MSMTGTAAAEAAKTYSMTVATVAVTGSFFGMQYDALIAALAGTVFALAISNIIMERWRTVLWLVTSTMLAAYLAPVGSSWATAHIDSLAQHADAVRMAIAAMVGAGSRQLIPAVVNRAEKTISGSN